jgi:hypothetical protein
MPRPKIVDIAVFRSQMKTVEPFACPIGESLWLKYRKRNPHGLTVPPDSPEHCDDPKLAEYYDHVAMCDDCNKI